jgi:poly-beta-1,6-N-acetyl-D-glucosamine synthase
MPLVDICLAILFGLFALATWVNGLWYAAARLPHAPQVLGKNASDGVSLLVCARNEAHNLRRHLPTLLGQICSAPYEVLVVDDASDDDTPEVLAALRQQYAHLRTLRIETKIFSGKKHALAQGIASAAHDLILLTDADCQPMSARWLDLMTSPLRLDPTTELVLGYAPCGDRPDAPPSTWLDRWIRFETAHTAWTYLAFARLGRPYMGVGRTMRGICSMRLWG